MSAQTKNEDAFVDYFSKEMALLKEQGNAFSKLHPKVAQNIGFDGRQNQDPHIERLLESFAFLSAKIQRNIDNSFGDFATLTLLVLYPYILHPIPSMAVIKIDVDAKKSIIQRGKHLPARSFVSAQSQNVECKFQTVYPLDILPIDIIGASFVEDINDRQEQTNYLKLSFKNNARDIRALFGKIITVFINKDLSQGSEIYEMLFEKNEDGLVKYNEKTQPILPVISLGFKPEEYAVNNPGKETFIEQLWRDYFHFPQKFLFFNITLPDQFEDQSMDEFDILLPVSLCGYKRSLPSISQETFTIHTVPIVNVFPQSFEPIRWNHKRVSYPITADQRHPDSYGLYDISSVRMVESGNTKSQEIPFFHYPTSDEYLKSKVFCLTKREPAQNGGGSNVVISFVDLNLNPALPSDQVVYVQGFSTNRSEPKLLSANIPIRINGMNSQAEGSFLISPNKPFDDAGFGDHSWVLLAHLNQTPLLKGGEKAYLNQIRQLLMVYARYASYKVHPEVLTDISIKSVVRRLGEDSWKGFVRGSEVIITLDSSKKGYFSPFLFGKILALYLQNSSPLHSFFDVLIKYSDSEKTFLWKHEIS